MKFFCYFFLLCLPLKAGVFGDIEFGDDYRTVQQKLMASDLVKSDLPETLMARTGINGIFSTTKTINNESFELFFTFEKERLASMMLKSSNKNRLRRALTLLEGTAKELDKIYGAASQAASAPEQSSLPVGASSLFRVWHPKEGGSVLIGLENNEKGFVVLISLQKKFIKLRQEPAEESP